MANRIPHITIETVEAALRGPRLGLRAQVRMMPRPRVSWFQNAPVRHGGVLLLLYPKRGELHLALTQRTDTLSNHKGQVSLPGGAWEPGESFARTALREAQEELGVDPAQIRIIGGLTALFIPPSRYCIHPVVGYAAMQPTFRPDPCEVAEVLEVPLARLIDPAVVREELWSWEGLDMYVPIYNLNDHKVWGATAMVLAEFVELIAVVLRKDGAA